MASVPEMVSNPTLGKMRYQFWRDALKQIYDVGTSLLTQTTAYMYPHS